MSAKIFNVYDRGDLFMTGTAKEIAQAIDMPQTDTVYVYAITGSRYHRRYSFMYTGERREKGNEEEPIIVKPSKTRHEEVLEYLIWHLNYYGNTTLKGKPSEYEEELKEHGIKIKYRRSIFGKRNYILERI